jgi:GDP-L-fucose synthase
MTPASRVFIAGGDTLVGAALLDLLPQRGFTNLVGTSSDEPELTDAHQVAAFFRDARPEYVFLVGGPSGGIGRNRTHPANLMLANLQTITNVIDSAHRFGVCKLLYLASSCAYPRNAPQPLRIESLCTGPLEPTSESYATAKLAGWKLCEAYRAQYGCRFVTGFPANPFGPHDDFGADSGHVVPALLRRIHEATERGDPESRSCGGRVGHVGSSSTHAISQTLASSSCDITTEPHRSIWEVVRISPLPRWPGPSPMSWDTGLGSCSIRPSPTEPHSRRWIRRPLLALGWRPATDFRSAVAETYTWFRRHTAKEGHIHACATV